MSWGLAKLKFALVPLVLSLAPLYPAAHDRRPDKDSRQTTVAPRRTLKLDEALAKRCGKLGKACVLMKRKCTRLAFTLFYGGFGVISLSTRAVDLCGHVDCRVRPRFHGPRGRVRRAGPEHVTNIIVRWMDALWYFP